MHKLVYHPLHNSICKILVHYLDTGNGYCKLLDRKAGVLWDPREKKLKEPVKNQCKANKGKTLSLKL